MTRPLTDDQYSPGQTVHVHPGQGMALPGRRIPAFAGLAQATGGLYVEDERGMTIDEALVKGGLNFTVEAVTGPTVDVLTDSGVTRVTHPDYRMNVARYPDGRATPVGMTKGRYEIVQPGDAYRFAELLIGEGGANVAAAGTYGKPHGSKTYLALALDPFDIHGDGYQMHVTILNSYDGLSGLTALLAPLRLACTNQTTATFGKRAANRIALRHTRHIEGRIDEARQVLGLAERWETNFRKAADALLATPMTTREFGQFTETLWTPPEDDASKRSHTTHRNRTDALLRLYTAADTNEFGRGTRYAAFNAVTEYLDWVAPVRGADSPEVARYTRTLEGGRDDLKDKAFRQLLTV